MAMKKQLGLIPLLVLVAFVGFVGLLRGDTPAVDVILEKYVAALGGRAALEKITTMAMRGTMEFPQFGASGTTSEYFKGDHFAAITEVPGYGTVSTIYDGHKGWQVDPQRGTSEITGADFADLRRRADIHWNLKLAEYYPGLKVVNRESIGGQDAWKIEATVESWTYSFWFDMNSGLLVRFDTDRHTPDGPSSVVLSDYRRVGDVLFSFETSRSGAPVAWNRKLTEVKFNEPVDDAVFAKSPPSEQPK
jgi:hypothetical protein